MSRDDRACPGPCNRRYRSAWDYYDDVLAAWQSRANAYALLRAAEITPETFPASGEDRGPALVAPRAYRLPERPEPPKVPCTLGDPIWCAACVSTIRASLGRLDDLASLLESWADGHRGHSSGEPVSRRAADAGTPSPTANALDQLYGEFVDVEDEWRQRRRYDPRPRRPRNGHARRLTLSFVQGELADILASRDYVEWGGRVLKWERLLEAMSNSDPVIRNRPGRCPKCRMVNVLRTDSDDITKCRDCGLWLNEDEYQSQVLGVADDAVVRDSREAATS